MVKIDGSKCIVCESCIYDCFFKALSNEDNKIIVDENKCRNCGHCIAICPQNAVECVDLDMNEVKEYNKEEFYIEDEKILNFIKFRRSTRRFKDEKIKRQEIEKIIEAGRFTPTGGNSQGVSYIVVEDKLKEITKLGLETLNNLGEDILSREIIDENLSRYANNWTTGYKKYLENPDDDTYLFFNSKTIVLLVSNSAVDAGLAASNMELMANAMGVGVCFSGYFVRAVNSNKEIRDVLGLEEGQKAQVCMIMGYPEIEYFRTVPRNKAKIRFI
ncbi:MAG: nitroreductase family protein [Intestinibacter sp.]|uniref:nitroreductase family protein n=1 Tax=Intestinibacter sp. TaxID=1965304 RepID=UPI0025BE0F65|nr:nitroreductase family protein [Intestinibacter sp.]MCI6738438.1 nitroreductase family protein [Intestinibacter sp.]